MSRKRTIYATLVALLIAALAALAAYVLWPRGYEEMVPAESKAVVRIDLTQDAACATFAKNLTAQLGVAPDGLDLSRPLYAFVTPNEYVGLAAAVDDADKVKQSMARLVKDGKATACDESDDLQWTWLNKGWLVGWNSRALLVLGPGVAQERDMLRQTIARMVSGGESFSHTPAFEKLKAQGGAVQICSRLDALPAPYNTLFRLNIPADTPLDAVQLFASVSAKGSDVVLNATLESDNADVLAAIDEYEKAKGCIAVNVPDHDAPLFYMATRTHGKDFLALLQSDATLRGLMMGLNQVIDADRMLGTADGVLDLEVGSLDKEWNPTFRLTADNATPGIMDDSDYWMESAAKQKDVTLERTGATTFLLTNANRRVAFGTERAGKAVFFASPEMQNRPEAVHAPYAKCASADGDKLQAFFSLSVEQLKRQPCMQDGTARTIVDFLFPKASTMSYKAFMGRKATLVVK